LNHYASNLEPDDEELVSEDRCLQTRTSYPTEMKFTALYFEESTLKGKVFRSDSGEPISNSYILLVDGKDQEKHFDTNLHVRGNAECMQEMGCITFPRSVSNLCLANCYAGRFHRLSPCESEPSLTLGAQDHTW
jgi:hypothetical protein